MSRHIVSAASQFACAVRASRLDNEVICDDLGDVGHLSAFVRRLGASSHRSHVHLVRVLVVVAEADRLVERFVDVVVLPDLRGSFDDGLHAHFVALALQVLQRDRVGGDRPKIALRADEHDRRLFADLPDLDSPSLHALQAISVVDGDAEHEAVGFVVADLTIDTEVWVAAIVVDLKLDLLLFKLLWAAEDVKHVRLISLIEDLLLVIHDQTGLTHGTITDKNKLDRLLPCTCSFGSFGAGFVHRWKLLPVLASTDSSHYCWLFDP